MWELLLRDKEWWEQSAEKEPDGMSTPEQAERVRILSGVLPVPRVRNSYILDTGLSDGREDLVSWFNRPL